MQTGSCTPKTQLFLFFLMPPIMMVSQCAEMADSIYHLFLVSYISGLAIIYKTAFKMTAGYCILFVVSRSVHPWTTTMPLLFPPNGKLEPSPESSPLKHESQSDPHGKSLSAIKNWPGGGYMSPQVRIRCPKPYFPEVPSHFVFR